MDRTDLRWWPRWFRWWPRWLTWVVVAVVGTAVAVLVIWVLPQVLTRHPHIMKVADRYAAIGTTRLGLVTAVAAAGAAAGLAYTARTYRLTQQGQFTERYTKAVELLGHAQIEVRTGGIYAFERLMIDSRPDQPTILNVLCAFVRERTKSVLPDNQFPPTDVQTVLTVVGRRQPEPSEARIDLKSARLERANLIDAHLERAVLIDAHLELANLIGAHLERANLRGAHLERAFLVDAHLGGAHLGGAHLAGTLLEGAHLEGAHLEGTHLEGTHLERAFLAGTHLERAFLALATGMTQEQLDSAIVDDHTILPPGLHRPEGGSISGSR